MYQSILRSLAATCGLLSVTVAQNASSSASASAAVTSTSSAANLGPTISIDNCCNSSQNAVAWALIYGEPLIQFQKQLNAVYKAVNGSNAINTQAELASITGAAVVKPNVDTMYSRVIVDLSQSDLVLTVPNITGRFWIFPFYDIFGNNFANINPINGSQPGQYLIRRADDALVEPGLTTTVADPAYPNNIPKYQGIVNYPTTYGTMLIRIEVVYNDTQNINQVHRYQSQYNLTAVPRSIVQINSMQAPALTSAVINGTTNSTSNSTSTLQLLQLLGRVAQYNQAGNYSERYRVASILGQAGISNGQFYLPSGVNLTRAQNVADATITALVTANNSIQRLGNGWQIPTINGQFNTAYAERAYIAETGYQALLPYIVLYPGYDGPSFRSYTLAPNTSFLFTFSGKPPVGSLGFWSLTVYGADQYLINNTLNRYEVGDRTLSLAYQNGSYVYGPNATNTTTTPFQVLMQPADIPPPANWTGNWLPSPPGGGNLSFILRWYQPTINLTNGAYVYPVVQTIPSVRGLSSNSTSSNSTLPSNSTSLRLTHFLKRS